jgi:TetR/AcrR family fatty acid metabolism transcriptional regulator
MPTTTSLRTLRSTATREDIIAACVKLFARRGFHNTSISDMANSAGITKGAIYWHFENKEALFAAILDKMKHNWQVLVLRHVDEVADPRDKLDQLFENFYLLLVKDPDTSIFLQRVSIEPDERYSHLLSEAFERTADLIATIFEAGKERGIFKTDIDAKLISYTIICSLAGAHAQCLTNKNLSLHALVEEVKRGVLARALIGNPQILS